MRIPAPVILLDDRFFGFQSKLSVMMALTFTAGKAQFHCPRTAKCCLSSSKHAASRGLMVSSTGLAGEADAMHMPVESQT